MSSVTLDTSDVDQYLGKVMDFSPLREPIAANDIRRWVHAMHFPNLVHFDPDFAAASRWGKLVAPQSFAIATDDGHGAAPACVGCIPNSHLLFAGDEWWFYGPRIEPGDMVKNERIPFDYTVKETGFGPTAFQRGDNNYYNQHGDPIAKQRSTSLRYNAQAGGASVNEADFNDPDWSDEEIVDIENRVFSWVQMLHDLGHKERWWDDVSVGDQLPERVFGPHSIASFATEWRAYIVNTWGSMNLRKNDLEALGFTREMAGYENDPDMMKVNPFLTDGAYYGPSRGHLFPKYARRIGMPRGYGYGASMGSWVTDFLSGWAGEHGMVVHSTANYRGPALTGDITIQTAEVVDKMVDEEGRHLVQVKHLMTNQRGVKMCLGTAEIALPKKPG
ncbi:FAS1-like dehydratase domain-containing protein [Novosphingobium mangrovi (ex Huang et al. 2023)]|uniref:MaoC family dehydratase N-terminal domain-containing protein n=1 Tax=Novosphingobium mangrovi (ex Huang et al. 2023) TaxID=2976432 RepID=A0ABT2I501_9SPHN|nr:MaoC family dehydratase N-terminal domain-containing protein [Novosphingobium mangrovi (ex Huang et al. 2023)]MCT2399878.1 MaoC family dehydratase N-terminal domain-containing protein [Novosphingobium mangrovi (ex Huang et al. 2023)]